MRSRVIIISFAVIAVLALAIFGLTSPQPQRVEEVHIIMADGSSEKNPEQEYFRPKEIVVVIGVNNTVVWTNMDFSEKNAHDVTSDDGLFYSGFLDPGESWSYTFEDPGEYAYNCGLHPEWMVGKVIVREAA